MTPLLAPRVATILEKFDQSRLLVVGDLMLDEYFFGDVQRISPEAPVPIVRLRSESFRLGGAGNVAANARALGASPRLIGGVARDEAGDRFLSELDARGIDRSGIVFFDDRTTTTKTRIIAHNQQVVRCDREVDHDVSAAVEDRLIASCLDAVAGCSAVVVSDYAKGCLTPRVLKELFGAAAARNLPVVVDPAVRSFGLYQPVTMLTPNHHEAARAARLEGSGNDAIAAIGHRILELLATQSLLITRGESGMTLFERDRDPVHIPTVAREVFDVTGAGDTVSTTVGLALAAGATAVEAAVLSNHAAGVVVAKVGTATVTPAELLASFPRNEVG